MKPEIQEYLKKHVDFDMGWQLHILTQTAREPVLHIKDQQLPVSIDAKNYFLVLILKCQRQLECQRF